MPQYVSACITWHKLAQYGACVWELHAWVSRDRRLAKLLDYFRRALPSLKFGEEVGKITSAAVKELVIETELKKLADIWKEQRFTLHKYTNVSSLGPSGLLAQVEANLDCNKRGEVGG